MYIYIGFSSVYSSAKEKEREYTHTYVYIFLVFMYICRYRERETHYGTYTCTYKYMYIIYIYIYIFIYLYIYIYVCIYLCKYGHMDVYVNGYCPLLHEVLVVVALVGEPVAKAKWDLRGTLAHKALNREPMGAELSILEDIIPPQSNQYTRV